MSNVSIKLLREGAKLPTRGSAFAAGYDLYACLDGDKELIIPPHATAMLPTCRRARSAQLSPEAA